MKKIIIVVALKSVYSIAQDTSTAPIAPISQNAKDIQYQITQLQSSGIMEAINIAQTL